MSKPTIKIEVTDFRSCLSRKLGIEEVPTSQEIRERVQHAIKHAILSKCTHRAVDDDAVEENIDEAVATMEVSYKNLL